MCYANRYYHVLESGNIGQLNAVPSTTKSEVIKSLIAISKYTGCYEQLKAALKSYGIKSERPDALAAFVRIYSNTNNNLDEWFTKVKQILMPQENLLLRFLRLTGLRCSEGIESFNLIIELSVNRRLHEYLSAETGMIVTCFTDCQHEGFIKYYLLRDYSPNRDFYGTFMIKHGLVPQEADLLCGRIPPSVFVRHYFSPAIKELKERTLKALGEMKGLQ